MLGRSFLPTWVALALILAVQMLVLVVAPESPRARGFEWSGSATVAVAAVVVTVTGAWAFPKVRATTWLIGAMVVTVIALQHPVVAFHTPVPPAEEQFVFYTVAAILLAIGAWERARNQTAESPGR